MISKSFDIISEYPVRKNRRQKQMFRADVTAFFNKEGYSCCEEKGMFGDRNLIVGNPETAEFLITAHYDTCARLPIPNLITPCNRWLFLLYQLALTALLMVPPAFVGILLGNLVSPVTGYNCFMCLLWVMVILVMVGPANPSNVNDNTSGVLAVMESAAAMPQELRDKVCYVLFDLEEAGLLGSMSYRKKHRKQTNQQWVLNCDCVGEGNDIFFFPTAKLKSDREKIIALKACEIQSGEKRIHVHDKGFGIYPSDQTQFPYGVGICAMNMSSFGYYLAKIHTPKDKILDRKNISILQNCLIDFISSNAAK